MHFCSYNEFKGKQDLYKQQSPQVLDELRQVAVIQSTESSNAIENIEKVKEESLVNDKEGRVVVGTDNSLNRV